MGSDIKKLNYHDYLKFASHLQRVPNKTMSVVIFCTDKWEI